MKDCGDAVCAMTDHGKKPKKPLAPIERHSFEPSDDPNAPHKCRYCGHDKRNGVHK